MPTERLLADELLQPISPEQPAGENLRWLPEWDRMKETRQSDDGLNAGKWAKKEAKTANWRLAQELTTAMLRTRSKDLQVAMWLTEACVRLEGFAGLRDGLRVVRELLVRFWDAGLYPAIEDGPEDRSGPFEWMDEKLSDTVLSTPITRSSSLGKDFSLSDLRDARLVGSEAQYKSDDGEIDPQKKREFDKAVAEGRISLDAFDSAVKDTPLDSYEALQSDFEEAYQEFGRLEQTIDEKFGDNPPSLATIRTTLKDISEELSSRVGRKRSQEQALSINQQSKRAEIPAGLNASTLGVTLVSLASQPSSSSSSWQEAERMVRAGHVDGGLVEMSRLAANETTGRNRFERKLLLAEVCLASNRSRLATAILQELAELIETHHLDNWESSELISGVWSRLYELYKSSESPDPDEASKLYGKLCRLDPWQALRCSQ